MKFNRILASIFLALVCLTGTEAFAQASRLRVKTVTASTTLDASTQVLECDTTNGAITVTLFPASTPRFVTITNKTGTNAVTIVPSGNDTINGATSFTLTADNDNATLWSTGGSRWYSSASESASAVGGSFTTFAASSNGSIGGNLALTGNLAINSTKLTVTGASGVVSSIPTTTTGSAMTYDFSALTSGNGFKLIGVDSVLNGGKYVNIFGGVGATSVWSIGEGGATLITPNVATIVPFYIDGTVTTSADLFTIKAVDATLNGGKYINLLGGAGATSEFSVAEAGVVTAAGVVYADGGVDRSSAAALAIGATNATGVTITPALTCSSTIASGAITSTAGVTGTMFTSTAQTLTVADNGGGTAATATLTPTSSVVVVVCNDTDGCTITMGEGSAATGQRVTIVNTSANAAAFADTAGVSELAGAFSMGQYDVLNLVYAGSTWIETSRSNN